MSLLTRLKTTIKEARDTEDMRATIERQQAQLEYVAVMADVDLLEDEGMVEDEMEGYGDE